MKLIDDFLNKTTMYRVMLYYLTALWVIAFICSFFGFVPYSPLPLFLSLIVLLFAAYVTNKACAYFLKVPANVESIYISVFILALILSPAGTASEYLILAFTGGFAMASKYIFAIKHKHIFNPAAFAVVAGTLLFGQWASWWVGAGVLTPFVFVGGLLIIKKIKRVDLTISFLIVSLLSIIAFNFFRGLPAQTGGNILNIIQTTLLYSPLFFFAFVMLPEPLTSPTSRWPRIIYGTLVGFLFAFPFHIGAVYFTPEISLLAGNFFAYIVSPKKRLTLKLKKSIPITSDVTEFIFDTNHSFDFRSGQYLEWTLGHEKPDTRGNRRYFTIASSPTEKELRLGVKFYEKGSTFKKTLREMDPGHTIIAGQLSGDFVLPKDKNKKLVFIGGGIGITPFRSMIKYLIDMKEKRDVVLIYSNKKDSGIAYKDIFDIATKYFNLKVIYTSFIEEKIILEGVKDWHERTFYISGPPSMVDHAKKIIKNLGVKNSDIKTDFFPGYA